MIKYSMSDLTLENFLGQEEIIKNLKIFIDSAKRKSAPLDHVILYGPPGLGKTTLGNLIAKTMGGRMVTLSAPAITKVSEIAPVLASIKKNDIVFIDEIHRLSKNIEEILYVAMENFRLDIIVGKNNTTKAVAIPLPGFTLIGATTMYGKISAPLRHRFGITFKFDSYSTDSLVKLLEQKICEEKLTFELEALEQIAVVSRGVPRLCLKYLRRVLDFCYSRETEKLTKAETINILKELGIDEEGLESIDRKYLSVIATKFSGGPVGVETLASAMDESIDTIENTIEPYLTKLGLVRKTPKGRVLTEQTISKIKKKQIQF